MIAVVRGHLQSFGESLVDDRVPHEILYRAMACQSRCIEISDILDADQRRHMHRIRGTSSFPRDDARLHRIEPANELSNIPGTKFVGVLNPGSREEHSLLLEEDLVEIWS